MRVNVYAEEMTNRIEIITKKTPDGVFTGLRFYLELPCSLPKRKIEYTDADGKQRMGELNEENVHGPFIHHPGDDDSAAVTFWGKRDLRELLQTALIALDKHYCDMDDE